MGAAFAEATTHLDGNRHVYNDGHLRVTHIRLLDYLVDRHAFHTSGVYTPRAAHMPPEMD